MTATNLNNLRENAARTAISLFAHGPDYDQVVYDAFQKIFPDGELLKKISAIMLQPSFIVAENDAKRRKTGASSEAIPEILRRQWDLLSACNGPESRNGFFLRRVQMRALEKEIFLSFPNSFLERYTYVSDRIFSFLDIEQMGRVATCSTELNYRLSVPSPRIWTGITKTFGLPDHYWPECSRSAARKNLELLQRVNRTFVFCCKERVARGEICEFAGIKDSGKLGENPLALHSKDPRIAFSKHTFHIINAIIKENKPPCEAFHRLISRNYSYLNSAPEIYSEFFKNTFRISCAIVEMFFTCGERGNEKTLSQLTGFQLAIAHDDGYEIELRALELIAKDGALPDSFDSLLPHFANIPKERLISILEKLIKRGVKPSASTVKRLCEHGPLELLRPIIEGLGAVVSPDDIGALVKSLPRKRAICLETGKDAAFDLRLETPETIVAALDLLLKHGKERHNPNNYFAGWRIGGSIFAALARYQSDALLKKVVELGFRPHEESLSCALETGAPFEEIALLYKYGAQPPKNVARWIKEHYWRRPSLRRELEDLLVTPSQKLNIINKKLFE